KRALRTSLELTSPDWSKSRTKTPDRLCFCSLTKATAQLPKSEPHTPRPRWIKDEMLACFNNTARRSANELKNIQFGIVIIPIAPSFTTKFVVLNMKQL